MEHGRNNAKMLLVKKITLVISLFELSCALAMAQVSQPEATRIVTVCDILSKPLQFKPKMVTIRSQVTGTDEGAWLISSDCPGALITDQHVWPSEIALVAANYRRSVDFQFDEKSQRRADARYKELRVRAPDRCIAFTYTGLFETRTNWSESKAIYADGTFKFMGFGHLSEAPAQLIEKSVDDVSIIANCSTQRTSKQRETSKKP